jgi:hypothetical protein
LFENRFMFFVAFAARTTSFRSAMFWDSNRSKQVLVFTASFFIALNAGVIAWLFLAPQKNTGDDKQTSPAAAPAAAQSPAATPEPQSPPPVPPPATPPQQRVSVSVTGSPVATPPERFTASFHLREERRQLAFSKSLADIGKNFRAGDTLEISFPLFDGKSVSLSIQKFDRFGADEGVFFAKVAGEPGGGDAQLSYVGDVFSGRIHLPSQNLFFNIRHGGTAGSSYLTQEDPSKMPVCGTCAPAQRK